MNDIYTKNYDSALEEQFRNTPISPLYDVLFARIFADMESASAALSLINAVLTDAGRESVGELLEIRQQENLPGGVDDKSCRLDILAKTASGLVNIEVQCGDGGGMIERSLYYATNLISRSLRPGMSYYDIPSVTAINLLDTPPLRPSHPDFHQPIQMSYLKEPHECASSTLIIHNIELRKFKVQEMDITNPLHRWVYMLREGYATIDQIFTKEVLAMDTGLEQFAQKYKLNTADPKVHEWYVQHLFKSMDYKTDMIDAADKGRTEGIEEVFLKTLKYIPPSQWKNAAAESGIKPERCEELIKQYQSSVGGEMGQDKPSVVKKIRESQEKPKQPRTPKSKKRGDIEK